jgi:type VI secretion system secreted protein Hcp
MPEIRLTLIGVKVGVVSATSGDAASLCESKTVAAPERTKDTQAKRTGNVARAQLDGMPVQAFEFSESVPMDPVSGMATARREHPPVRVVHEVNEWSPWILSSLVTNEALSRVLIEFYEKDSTGKLAKYFEISLTHARVSSVRQFTDNNQFLEEILFKYLLVEETHFPSGHFASDTTGPAS